MTQLHRFSFSIEKSLADKLERMIQESHYANRSEFIRDLVRGKLVAGEWGTDGEALGTISLLYDHHKRLLSEKLIAVQHHHAAKVLAATHVHLDERICAEMIMVKGKRSISVTYLTTCARRRASCTRPFHSVQRAKSCKFF